MRGGETVEMNLKLHSITRRWFITVLPIVLIVIVICEVFIGVSIFDYYRSLVTDRVSDYVRDINVLSLSDEEGFPDAARSYAHNFMFRDKIEVQIFDSDGNMIVTTNGFASQGIAQKATDYKEAVSNGTEASWVGKNANGERVLAITTVLSDLGYGSNGAYRILVSMEEVTKSCYGIFAAAIVVGLITIVFFLFSGLFFVSSVVRPVRAVTAAARRIAAGDMRSRLEVKHNDEIGELCDTINFMASELENADKLKNDFISSVSHELRTPLTAIKGWGETVNMSIGEDDEVVRRGMDVILGEADRLSGLVEELLDFSRLESGKMTFTPALCDPLRIVGSVVEMYGEIAHQNTLTLNFVKPEKTEQIMADADRIKQVFINTIDNAVKYTDAGGHIVVSVFNEEACVRVTISDTGCGIANKDIDHVKEKFYKANNNVRGSGIGLAVADEIIRHHNGLLFVESTEGEGTTVTVVLPTVKIEENEITEVIFPPEQA